MDLDVEPILDGSQAFRRGELGVVGFDLGDEGDDLGRDLVSFFGAARFGHEAGQTSVRERGLGLVEGGPRDAAGPRCVADRQTVDLMTSDHLVAQLDQISGIEERMADEQGILDGIGMRIEGVVACERLAFEIATAWFGHISFLRNVKINTPLYIDHQA